MKCHQVLLSLGHSLKLFTISLGTMAFLFHRRLGQSVYACQSSSQLVGFRREARVADITDSSLQTPRDNGGEGAISFHDR